MSSETGRGGRKMGDKDILKFVRTHEDPCVTAGEVAARFDVTNEAANYRLRKLENQCKVGSKTVGASAKIWWVLG